MVRDVQQAGAMVERPRSDQTVDPVMSVIIPAHNAGRFIGAALASLTAQSRQDFEVIVVDDGSADDTVAQVQACVAAQGGTGPDIRLIAQPRAGVSHARNAGLRAARAGLVALLDADDRWAPDKVARHLAAMQANPEVVLSFSGYRFVDAAGADLMQGYAPPAGTLPLARLMLRNVIHASTVVMRRDVALRLGGFATDLTTCEDYDLWLRIAALSDEAVLALPAPLADYRRHDGQVTRDWRQMHAGWRQVAARLAQDHPQLWAQVHRRAWGNQLEYCASLAYGAGDIATTRRLIWQAWRRGGVGLLTQPNALAMTRVALVTYLPGPLRRVVGAGEYYARRALSKAKAHRQPR